MRTIILNRKSAFCIVVRLGRYNDGNGDGDGMQLLCTHHLTGKKIFIEVLQKQLLSMHRLLSIDINSTDMRDLYATTKV